MDIALENIFYALLVSLLASAFAIVGWLSVFFKKTKDHARYLAFGLAFAAGAMIYISFVEIFDKSFLEYTALFPNGNAYAYTTVTFFMGIGLVLLLDRAIPHPHGAMTVKGLVKDNRQVLRIALLTFGAITAHNIPEGMATFFSTVKDPALGISLASAIAIHNIPEGVSIAIPIFIATKSKMKAFLATFISAIAEFIGALLGWLLLASIDVSFLFAVMFGLIAGAMVYLALDELLPMARRYARGHDTTYGLITGMAVIALSLVLLR